MRKGMITKRGGKKIFFYDFVIIIVIEKMAYIGV